MNERETNMIDEINGIYKDFGIEKEYEEQLENYRSKIKYLKRRQGKRPEQRPEQRQRRPSLNQSNGSSPRMEAAGP